ncbi:MAG: hypothetical protein CM15mP46_6970 [Alphaproteobacteria bacterium]|nr:MAG: hypothetical protein CM15mP46_6970 [Alphaproteobacteria bacterium]
MFIQTQDTPKPGTLGFIPGVPVKSRAQLIFPIWVRAQTKPLGRGYSG